MHEAIMGTSKRKIRVLEFIAADKFHPLFIIRGAGDVYGAFTPLEVDPGNNPIDGQGLYREHDTQKSAGKVLLLN